MNSHLYTAAEDGVETPFSSLPGTVLDGGYEVQDLLRSEPHASVFRVRKLGDRYTQAEVTFFGLDERESAVQIECWRTAKNLSSPHLNAPLSFGTRTVGETMIPYVVLTKADETLAGVILERPLEAAEASEAMLNAARALVDLHTSGLIHGCVSPEHILSIGEDIKLSGHTARPAGTNSQTIPAKPAYLAPESSGRNSTACRRHVVFGSVPCRGLYSETVRRQIRRPTRQPSQTIRIHSQALPRDRTLVSTHRLRSSRYAGGPDSSPGPRSCPVSRCRNSRLRHRSVASDQARARS